MRSIYSFTCLLIPMGEICFLTLWELYLALWLALNNWNVSWHDIYQMGYCSVFLSFWATLTYSKESTVHAAAVFSPGWVNEDVKTDLNQPADWSTASAPDLQVWGWEMNVCCCKPVRFWQDYLSKNWWKEYPTIKSPPTTIKRIPEKPEHPFIVTEHW